MSGLVNREHRFLKPWPWFSGPLLTVGTLTAIELLSRAAFGIPNPPAFLLLTVVFSAFNGGLRAGLLSAVISWLYIAYFFSLPGQPFQYTGENLRRVIVWAMTTPTMALMVGILKRRADHSALYAGHVQAREIAEASFQGLLEAAPDAIVVANREGAIVLVNRQAEQMFSYDRHELLGQPVEILLPERFRNAHVAYRAIYSSNPQVRPMGLGRDLAGRRKDGSEFPVNITLSPIKAAEGTLIISSIRNITERKRIEAALRESEQRYRLIAEHTSDLIALLDQEGRYRYVSPSIRQILGYEPAALVGRSGFDLIHPDDLPPVLEQWAQIIERGSMQATFRCRHTDGSWRWIEAHRTAFAQPGGYAVVAVSRDITERKRVEEELRLLQTITQAVANAEDFHSALGITLDRVGAATGWDYGEAWIPSTDQSVLECSPAWYGDPQILAPLRQATQPITFAASAGLPGRVWSSRLPEWIPDVSASPDTVFLRVQAAAAAGLKAGLGVPIIAADQVLAVLVFFMRQACVEDRRLVNLVSAVAAQLGTVILRKRAEEALRESESNARSLLRLSRRLEQAQTFPEALEAALDEVRAVLGYQNAWIYLLSEDKEHASLLTTTGGKAQQIADELPTLTIRGDRFLEEIAEGKDVVLVEDACTDPRTNKQIVAQLGNRTIVNIPIILKDRHLGAFGTGTFGDEGIKVPTRVQLEYLSALASHLAVTLDRVHLLIERKRAEEALAQALARNEEALALLDTLMTTAPVGLAFLDHDLRFVYINEHMAAINGLPRAEHHGRTLHDVLPTLAPTVGPIYRRVLETQQPLTGLEISGETPAAPGQQRYWLANYYPVAVQRGVIIGVGVVVEEITARKQTEEELRRYQASLEVAQERAHLGSWELDLHSMTGMWSKEMFRLHGLEVTDHPPAFAEFIELVHPEDRQHLLDMHDRILRTGEPGSMEYRTNPERCPLRVLSVTIHTVENAEGEVTLLMGTSLDITERKQAEEQVRRQAARDQALAEVSRALVEATTEYQAVLDIITRRVAELIGETCVIRLLSDDGQWLNPVAMYHPDPEALAFMRELLPAVPQSALEGLGGHVLESGEPLLIATMPPEQSRAAIKPEYWPLLDRFGTRSIMIAPLRGQGQLIGTLTVSRGQTGRPYTADDLTFLQDLADRAALAIGNARLFETVQRLNADLEQRVAERTAQLEATNKELEAFSYSVSHDLRAPLRSIDGFSQALLEDYADQLDAQGQDYLQRVRTASQRMAQLIDDLLNLSRVTRTELRRTAVDLSALARAIMADLQRAQPERQVETIIADELVVEGDARLLRIALENLLSNAWKFTARHPHARIEFGVTRHDGQAAYFVRDDGAGFDMAYANKLFGPFQRLHTPTEFEGTGIGLVIVQRIIHRHGGHIWAESAVEQGATFYFTL